MIDLVSLLANMGTFAAARQRDADANRDAPDNINEVVAAVVHGWMLTLQKVQLGSSVRVERIAPAAFSAAPAVCPAEASERPGGAECLFSGGHLWETKPGGRCLRCSPPRPAEARVAALDVRRVVKAIENVAARHGIKKDPPVDASLARIYGYSTTPDDMDAQIAAEYAALAAKEPR